MRAGSDPAARLHLQAVAPIESDDPVVASDPRRPATIGRLIAQTALIADSVATRRRETDSRPRSRFGWFF